MLKKRISRAHFSDAKPIFISISSKILGIVQKNYKGLILAIKEVLPSEEKGMVIRIVPTSCVAKMRNVGGK